MNFFIEKPTEVQKSQGRKALSDASQQSQGKMATCLRHLDKDRTKHPLELVNFLR